MNDLVVPMWTWAVLAGLMVALLTIDLVAHRGDHIDSRKRALVWSLVWVGVGLGFGGFVALRFGADAGEQYLAAYLLEKSLSVDNLFVFMLIFASLGIPASEQRRVLTWGILGALITRGLFIAAGAAAISRWHVVTYVLGGILLVTSFKLLASGEQPGSKRVLEWLERRLPWTQKLHGHHFFTRLDGRLLATPMFMALIAIELTDVVFAVDSVPAAFAVSDEPFIIYSSNVLAVLGLRALYIVLAGVLAELRYLRFGLAAVLAFAGGKMLTTRWVHVPPIASVSVIVVLIGGAVAASVYAMRREQRQGVREAIKAA
jgi:tellurite resistance protein TerC